MFLQDPSGKRCKVTFCSPPKKQALATCGSFEAQPPAAEEAIGYATSSKRAGLALATPGVPAGVAPAAPRGRAAGAGGGTRDDGEVKLGSDGGVQHP